MTSSSKANYGSRGFSMQMASDGRCFGLAGMKPPDVSARLHSDSAQEDRV